MTSYRGQALAAIALAALLPALVHAQISGQATGTTADFTAAERGQILDGISGALRVYIYPDVADTVRATLRGRHDTLVAIADPTQFAKSVSNLMSASGNDKHLYLYYSVEPLENSQDPTPSEIAHDKQSDVLHNAGVRTAQWLPGNIGYIRISGFPEDAPGVRHAIDAAMATVGQTAP